MLSSLQSSLFFQLLYDEVPLLNGSDIDFDTLEKMVDKTTTMVLIQRSKGYSTRKSLSIETIEKICKTVKSKNTNTGAYVDCSLRATNPHSNPQLNGH